MSSKTIKEMLRDFVRCFWPIILFALLILGIIFLSSIWVEARAEELVDIDIIIQIESSGNPNAYNKGSGAIGLMQITDIVRREFNTYKNSDISDWAIQMPCYNVLVGTWYLQERIPQMLRYFKKPTNLENVLICYNAGINYVVKGLPLPTETKNYIKKYKLLKDKK